MSESAMKELGTGSSVLGDILDVSTLGLQLQVLDDEDENVVPSEEESRGHHGPFNYGQYGD